MKDLELRTIEEPHAKGNGRTNADLLKSSHKISDTLWKAMRNSTKGVFLTHGLHLPGIDKVVPTWSKLHPVPKQLAINELEILYPLIQEAKDQHVAVYLLSSHSRNRNSGTIASGSEDGPQVQTAAPVTAAVPLAAPKTVAAPKFVLECNEHH